MFPAIQSDKELCPAFILTSAGIAQTFVIVWYTTQTLYCEEFPDVGCFEDNY